MSLGRHRRRRSGGSGSSSSSGDRQHGRRFGLIRREQSQTLLEELFSDPGHADSAFFPSRTRLAVEERRAALCERDERACELHDQHACTGRRCVRSVDGLDIVGREWVSTIVAAAVGRLGRATGVCGRAARVARRCQRILFREEDQLRPAHARRERGRRRRTDDGGSSGRNVAGEQLANAGLEARQHQRQRHVPAAARLREGDTLVLRREGSRADRR